MTRQPEQTIVLDLRRELHRDLADELEKQSVYIDTGLRWLRVDQTLRNIEISVDPARSDEIVAVVKRFVSALQGGFRPVESKTIGANVRSASNPYERDVFEKLVNRGWVLDLGTGQVGLAGAALALAEGLDSQIKAIGVERFHAAPRQYPALIPATVLAQCGYTSSFPQHLSVVSHLDESFDAIEAFRQANVDQTDLRIPDRSAFGLPKVCLCPALCYHCYPTLARTTLPAQGHVETATGRIARYESSSMIGLDRLWEFSQRSIIWLGEDGYCTERREQAIQAALEMARSWDIDCTIETANDPFFTSVSTAKSFWQRGQDLKFELRANLESADEPNAKTVAAASFNLHSTYFGNAFDISAASGGPAFSGCASWGIERLVLVMFTQHGFRLDAWPEKLRAFVG